MSIALLALAACTSQPPSPPATATSTQTRVPAATQPAATLPPPATPIPCFTRGALAEMALPDIAALPTLCFDSEDGATTAILQAEAIETIRSFLQDPTRVVGFREPTSMANSPNGALRVARFEDERGVSYLVAAVAEKVLEIDPGASQPQPTGPALEQNALQAIAERTHPPRVAGLR